MTCKDVKPQCTPLIIKKSGEHSYPQEYGKDEVTVMKDLMTEASERN